MGWSIRICTGQKGGGHWVIHNGRLVTVSDLALASEGLGLLKAYGVSAKCEGWEKWRGSRKHDVEVGPYTAIETSYRSNNVIVNFMSKPSQSLPRAP